MFFLAHISHKVVTFFKLAYFFSTENTKGTFSYIYSENINTNPHICVCD